MSVKCARLYDMVALSTVLVILILDQWVKSLVVANLTLGEEVPLPGVGHYLVLQYIQNSGAAFSMLENNALLLVLIVLAMGVIGYLYSRIWNTGSLFYKFVFGLIIGGAIGNLIDRFFRGGAVVDYMSFRIPEIDFYFAIFNVADACISVGVFFLFVLALFSREKEEVASTAAKQPEASQQSSSHP